MTTIRVNSMLVTVMPGGNIGISTSHTPEDRYVVQLADVEDLLHALQILAKELGWDSGGK